MRAFYCNVYTKENLSAIYVYEPIKNIEVPLFFCKIYIFEVYIQIHNLFNNCWYSMRIWPHAEHTYWKNQVRLGLEFGMRVGRIMRGRISIMMFPIITVLKMEVK